MQELEYKKINSMYYRYMPLLIIATITINILSLALPLSLKQIYSSVILNQSFGTLYVIVAVCLVAFLLEAIMKYAKDSTTKWIAAKYEYKLSDYFIKKILGAISTENIFNSFNSNLDRFKSIGKVASFRATSLHQMYVDFPFIIIFLYVIYLLGGLLVLVPIVIAAVYIVTMFIVSLRYESARKTQIIANEKTLDNLSESIDKIHLIKAAGIENYQISKYKKALSKYSESEFAVNGIKMIPDNISSYVVKVNLFAMLTVGGYLIMLGQLNFGDIIACSLIGGRALAPVQSMMKLYMVNNDIKILKDRIDEVAQQKEQYDASVPMFPEEITGNIELINVQYKSSLDEQPKQVTAKIKAGSFVVINPADFIEYRTILRMITGNQVITSGSVLIDSLNIEQWNMNSLKGKLEYLNDSVSIFKGTIMENVTFFNHLKNRDVYEAAALTGFDRMVAQMPEGFETKLDSQSVNLLPTSFLQRLNLTRGLIYRPRILVIDRLAESMDYETLDRFRWILKMLKGKVTIIIATYDKEIESMADCKLGRRAS